MLLVLVISIIEAKKHRKSISGFFMFTIGGLTNTTGIIMNKYYKINDDKHADELKYNLGIVYMLLEDLPQLIL